MAHERRKHPRAQVTMPVRLRWPGPLRQTTEITETLDVSRGGLLVYSVDGPHPGRALWLTFPFENSMIAPEPEILAHVLRVERRASGGSFIAIHFDGPAVSSAKPLVERRLAPRTAIGVPVSVRAPSCPWPEDAMTLDVSADGLSFITPRVYTVGDTLKVAMLPGVTPSGWSSPGEIAARVVRVALVPVSLSQMAPPSAVSCNGDSAATSNAPTMVDSPAPCGAPVSPDNFAPESHAASESNGSPVVNAPPSLAANDQLVALRRLR